MPPGQGVVSSSGFRSGFKPREPTVLAYRKDFRDGTLDSNQDGESCAQRTAHSAQRTAHSGWWSVFALTIAVILGKATERVAVAQCNTCESNTVRYVRDGGNDSCSGQCWGEAFATIDAALADLHAPNSTVTLIKIAGGIYRPTGTNAGFVIEREVTIEGGYRGNTTGGDPDDRDPSVFVTILSGDIGENDDADPPVLTDNSFHVVEIYLTTGTVKVDGVTITAGHAQDPLSSGERYGGGVYAPRWFFGEKHIQLDRCRFESCSSEFGGGAVYVDHYTTTELRRSTFASNVISGDTPEGGGAAYIYLVDELIISQCEFLQNETVGAGDGGGLATRDMGLINIANSTFLGNVAGPGAWGGALAFNNGLDFAELTNCVIAGNESGENAGGLYSSWNTRISNCTIVGNATGAFALSAGVDCQGDLEVVNSIVRDNTGAAFVSTLQRQLYGDASLDIAFSCVSGVGSGNGNVDVDPKFIDPGSGDYRLDRCSPLIDAGDNDLVSLDLTDLDEDGHTTDQLVPWALGPIGMNTDRILAAVVDMGAYEHEPSTCPADLNDDGTVNGGDLTLLLAAWGACPSGDSFMGSGSSMESMFSGGSSSLTPALLASLFEFESVEAFSLWLSQQEFETMSSILSLLIGE